MLPASAGTPDGQFRVSALGPDGYSAYDAVASDVAYGEAADEFLIVWIGDDTTGTLVNEEFEVFAQRIDATTGAEVGSDDSA